MLFSAFMAHALYDAREGYYASGRASVGTSGDFYTNVSVGAVYGELLADQFLEMRGVLGEDFVIVEQGANDGRLAGDVLEALERRGEGPIPYWIIEPFAPLRVRQEALLAGKNVRWFSSLHDLPAFEGVHFSNELFDALPVDLVRSRGGTWCELRVTVADGKFEWSEGDEFVGELPPRPAGYTTEIRTTHRPLLASLAAKLRRGFLLAVDYGWNREAFFAPHRSEGSLSCYSGHRRDSLPLEEPGTKDISAHVDFSQLAADAEAGGWRLDGFTDQHHFLVGAAKRLLTEMDGAPPSPENAKKLRTLQTLMHPESMGTQFHALLLSRGLAHPSRFSGFQFALPAASQLY